MENLSLWKLQDVLLEAEEGLSDETVNLDEVIGDIRNKVDNIKQIIDMMYDEAARFKRYELEMKKKGTTFELGNVWTAKIREGKYVNTTRDPEPLDLMLFPNLVKTSYSWDKRAIKDTLVEKPLDFAEMAKSRSLTFTARKPTHD
jgi:hypothetical protein